MMATTHVFAGVSVAALLAVVAPEFAFVAAIAAICGATVPDLDVPAAHRKTLHFPVYFSGLAILFGGVALAAPTTGTVAVGVFFLAAALHCVMDAAGGGLEFKPWEGTSERAVYDHYHGRWIRPRRWIRYDGAPEDLLLASVLAVPGLVVFEGTIQSVLVVLLAVSVVYTVVRKPLVVAGERLLAALPRWVRDALPDHLLPVEDGPSRDCAQDRAEQRTSRRADETGSILEDAERHLGELEYPITSEEVAAEYDNEPIDVPNETESLGSVFDRLAGEQYDDPTEVRDAVYGEITGEAGTPDEANTERDLSRLDEEKGGSIGGSGSDSL